MIYLLSVAPSTPKTDRLPNGIRDFCDVRSKCRARHIEQDGFVAASNIESNATRADRIFVRDHTADWHGIAFVMVGHQRSLIGCLGTRFDLAKCAFVQRTAHWNVGD